MIETLHLFRPLNEKLIALLGSLTSSDWERGTVAVKWTVKDVAAHLLDGNIRAISLYRDEVVMQPDSPISSYGDLVQYLNQMNADWVKAMKRVSPAFLTVWLKNTHEDYIACLENLDPQMPARFSVAWAGDEVSPNWFHIAREFTEKWHHQQQIWHAVGRSGILTKEFYPSVLDTFMQALPFRYRHVPAGEGTTLHVVVDSPAGGEWFLQRLNYEWRLISEHARKDDTRVIIPADISWRLFTKALRYEDVKDQVSVEGDLKLARPLLDTIAVMA